MGLVSSPFLIVFDCDGTLIDGQHMVIATMKNAFAAHGLEPPDDRTTRRVIGLSLHQAVSHVLGAERLGYADRVTATFKDAFQQIRQSKTVDEALYDGARELVELLSAREDVLLGIATGKSRRGVDAMLEREGWEDCFATIQTADNAPSKPHPGMMLNAQSECGIEASSTVMIGDTTYDMEMARAAQATAFGVAWGYHPIDALKRAGAHTIVQEFVDLENQLVQFITCKDAR